MAQRPRRHGRFPHRYDDTHHARGADGAGGGGERISRGLEWPWPRSAARFARHHESSDRRPGAAGLADDALDLRDAHADGAIGQHAGVERERPVDLCDRRAMQHRDRVQALLPDDDCRLLGRAAGSEPAGRAADQQLLQAVHAGQHAGRSGNDHNDRRIDGAVHRARGARNDKSRHLRHRGSVRPQQAVVGALAAGAVEREGRLQLRRVDGPAAAAIPHGAELGR